MADSKVTALTAHTALIDTDVIPVVDITAVETKKTTWANIKSVLKTYFDTLYAGVLGADDNYVTDAQLVVIGNTSGTNSGNETATTLGATIGGAGDATPNDTDFVATSLTAAGVLKKITWTNVKAFLKTYFDTVYATLAGSVSQVFSVSSLEVGNADTTLSRVSAGVVAVEGVTVPTISSTSTFTNKRVTKRTGTTTSHATPTINTDNVDEYYITAQAEAITSMTTNLSGTPTLGQLLFVHIIGTAARGITWGASFANGPVALPTTTVTTTALSTLLKWDGSIWRCYATGSTV